MRHFRRLCAQLFHNLEQGVLLLESFNGTEHAKMLGLLELRSQFGDPTVDEGLHYVFIGRELFRVRVIKWDYILLALLILHRIVRQVAYHCWGLGLVQKRSFLHIEIVDIG